MAAATLPAYLRKPPGAVRSYYVDFGQYAEILNGDVLTGTPTVAEVTTADLTITNKAVASTRQVKGKTVSGQFVTFTVAGGLVVVGTYRIAVTVSTLAGATLVCTPELHVELL